MITMTWQINFDARKDNVTKKTKMVGGKRRVSTAISAF
jgi:hypothetical protein